MKLLENPRLAALTDFLTQREVGDRILDGRVEAFSCKRAGEDKKLSKKLDKQYIEEVASSLESVSQSPLGALSDSSTRRLLIDLISTMNASFPDHDFSALRPEQFTREASYEFVAHSINRKLAELTQCASDFQTELWAARRPGDHRAVEDAARLRECEVYSYVPDLDSDPFSEGILWSFNYFFFNKTLKRILFFTCIARSKYSGADGGPMIESDLDDDRIHQDYDDDDDDIHGHSPAGDLDF